MVCAHTDNILDYSVCVCVYLFIKLCAFCVSQAMCAFSCALFFPFELVVCAFLSVFLCNSIFTRDLCVRIILANNSHVRFLVYMHMLLFSRTNYVYTLFR